MKNLHCRVFFADKGAKLREEKIWATKNIVPKAERRRIFMLKKRFILFALCAGLAVLLTGCGNGRVESTVSDVISKAGEELDDAVSRVESAVDSMFEDDSRTEDSRLDSGLESGGNLDSDLADDGIVDDEGSDPSLPESSEDDNGIQPRTR